MSESIVYVPATCGELVQGTLDGEHFLVSCPIDLFSRVTVQLLPRGEVEAPEDSPKAAAAVRAALAFLGRADRGARLSILSPIPRGKGMGSSTADVGGAIYATAAAAGRKITPWEVSQLAISVEPTDSSLLPNLALFDHRRGSRYEDLGPPPAIDVLVLDAGGEVDTIAYNAAERGPILRRLARTHALALRRLREGVRAGDPRTIGAAATLSARAHQRLLPKPSLETAITLGQTFGAAGVCVGHSGTVIGMLFPRGQVDQMQVAERVRRDVPELAVISWQRLIGGGAYSSPHAITP